MAGGRPPYPNRCGVREASAAWRRGIDSPASGGDAWRLWRTTGAGWTARGQARFYWVFVLGLSWVSVAFALPPLGLVHFLWNYRQEELRPESLVNLHKFLLTGTIPSVKLPQNEQALTRICNA